MKLYILPPSPRAIKVVALKNFLELDLEIHVLDYFREDQKTPEFARLNPNKRMPVLEDDGLVLWESNAILRYLAAAKPQHGLWPDDLRQQADVMRWLFWEACHWDPACDVLITERVKKIVFKAGTPDPAVIAIGTRTFEDLAAILNEHLRGRRWICGDRLTIADFAIGAWIPAGERAHYPIGTYDEITRWYNSVVALPGWQGALPQSTQVAA
jgi:glutathione S-transferase